MKHSKKAPAAKKAAPMAAKKAPPAAKKATPPTGKKVPEQVSAHAAKKIAGAKRYAALGKEQI